MSRRIIKAMSVLQILLSIVAYISMSVHFVKDYTVFSMLADTGFVATTLRISLYAIPGIHLLSGLYGLVFTDSKILILIEIIELISCGSTFTFVGQSQYMLILSIVSCSIAVLYLLSVFNNKK